jgi:hypothetical protein
MPMKGTVTRTGIHGPMPRMVTIVGACGLAVGTGVMGCRPSDVLSVPPPAGVTPSSVYQNQSGAEGLLVVGKAQVFQGLAQGFSGLLQWGGLLGDEFTWAYFGNDPSAANIDARVTVGTGGFQESGDAAIQLLLKGRLTLLSALPSLEQYEPASGRSKIGEAFALLGYAELVTAEDYCAGVALDALVPVQGVRYGTPLTTDSLLGAAAADLDSAAAHASGDVTIAALAAVGRARARLDRGQFAAAAAVVSGVPTSFVYNTELEPGGFSSSAPQTFNLYDEETAALNCGFVNVGDRKGGNGLNYVSAQDPRLILSTAVAETCDGFYSGHADSVWYYPVKFGNPSTFVPLATGVEARLIEAEAALQAQQVGTWAGALNALRADSADTKVAFASLLTSDSTTTASAAEQVDVMFRERAFWLYGTGTRLGDLRRLIRQYGRDQSAVFPTGPYPHGNDSNLPSPLPNYGTDVSLTLPTAASGLSYPNPAYKGCLTSTKVP